MRHSFGLLGALLLGCASGSAWAMGGLMLKCDVSGAAVYIDGQYLGACPGKFTPSAGQHTLTLRKSIDADTEWRYSQSVYFPDGTPVRINAVLEKVYTEGYSQRQRQAEQARQEEQRRAEREAERERQAREKREAAEKQALIRQCKKEQPARARRAEQLSEEFAAIPGGCFQMGDVFGDGDSDEKPVHEVCVGDFKLGRYEVTQWQWQQVMGSNPSYFSYCEDQPVEQVSLEDVKTFIARLNVQTGRQYRLPTEAEWEYACRSGGKDERYCGGSDLETLAWYSENSGGTTHAVGGKMANGLGLYDMSGNVWEWTCSEWEDKYAGGEKICSSNNDANGRRAIRGGAWLFEPQFVRSADRNWIVAAYRNFDLGFRLAQD